MENDIKIEDSQYEYITEGFVRPVAPIRRFSQGSKRFYYKVLEDGEIELYSFGTTLIKDGFAEDKMALEDWRNKLKAEGKNPSTELKYLAMRGTVMHALLGDYVQQKRVNLKDINLHIAEFHPQLINEPFYMEVIRKDTLWLQKSVYSFAQFVKDFNIKPLAIELMLASEKYKVASPVDLICTMETEEKGFFEDLYKSGPRKGEPKESKRVTGLTAIVDFKSSANGFYDSQALQLKLYKRMVNENYPNIEIGAIYNWSPKAWTGTTPSYNLKEQSTGQIEDLAELVFEQGAVKHSWKNPKINVVADSIIYGEEIEFKQVPLKDYLKELHSGKDKSTEENSK